MTTLFRLFGTAAALALLISTGSAKDDKTGAGTTKLDGTYSVQSGERDGKAMSDQDIKECRVKITADKITATDGGGKEFLNCSFTLDETKKPHQITMKGTGANAGKSYVGLCEKTADGLRIAYPLDGGEPPTEFKTKDKQVVLVLKAVK